MLLWLLLYPKTAMNKDKDQTLSLIIKLNFLVLGFGLAVYSIYSLKTGGLPPAMANFFGLPVQKKVSLSWCDTRVTSVRFPGGHRVYQEGQKWKADSGEQRGPVDFLQVERWFGAFCKVPIESLVDGSKSLEKAVNIQFVDGRKAQFGWGPGPLFEWRGQLFRSPVLEEAFGELQALPIVD